MLRIRKVNDARTPANLSAVQAAQQIMRAQFSGIAPEDIDKLPDQLDNPFRYQFNSELLVAEDARGQVKGFALMMHDPTLAFSYLELISTPPGARSGSGVGGALYDRVREDCRERGSRGLYFECLPDQPDKSPDPVVRRQNIARLRFYERYGARPISGIDYDRPICPGDTDMPYLVFDGLGQHSLPGATVLRRIVRAILTRKYADLCPPSYVKAVLGSIRPENYQLRNLVHTKPEQITAPIAPASHNIFPIVSSELHDIHHVRERGYVEAPVRIKAILSVLEKSGLFQQIAPKSFPARYLREVHDADLLRYLEQACKEAPEKRSVYPYVFPVRNEERRPVDKSVLAGYYCIDTFTPINQNAWPAARAAADCALTAAECVLNGSRASYALVRPPGHHAERDTFGGFCYLSNGAIAANFLSHYGRVAMLDIDYHHGNGQQDIFYQRDDVLTVSIHGHPSFAYPYFTGFRNETGSGDGAGFNINIPLPETIDAAHYQRALRTALKHIEQFRPAYLVLLLGLDTARGDPTGTWSLVAKDFELIGQNIGSAGYPTVVVQEGGYKVRTLGENARAFFTGLATGTRQPALKPAAGKLMSKRANLSKEIWREAVRATDVGRIRDLVTATGMFSASEITIARELVEERVQRGKASGYEFILIEQADQLLAYACYGPIPGSQSSYDLYWIAVHPDAQGRGLGKAVLDRVVQAIQRSGATIVYADTSTSEHYEPTRNFYQRCGFRLAAQLPDFYSLGDGKAIFERRLSLANSPDQVASVSPETALQELVK